MNPLNERSHWANRAKRAKRQREAVAAVIVQTIFQNIGRQRWNREAPVPETPKCITFTAHVARKMDDDGLQAAIKSVRDGLQDCGLIHHDGPDSGHEFIYHQRVAKPTGVEIVVELA